MKVRIIVSVLFFAVLVMFDKLQYNGPLSDELRNVFVILLGFLLPALLIGRQPLRNKIVISSVFSAVAAIVWNIWSNSSDRAWEWSFFALILAVAFTVFGITLTANEFIIRLVSRKIAN